VDALLQLLTALVAVVTFNLLAVNAGADTRPGFAPAADEGGATARR
jgi:hypothetical protein